MMIQILLHTPIWVWVLLLGLLVLGGSQCRDRQVPLRRMLIVAGMLTSLSLAGAITTFAAHGLALLAWTAAALTVVSWIIRRPAPAGTRYGQQSKTFHIPGSSVPLGLMMAIFAIKYVAGVTLALHAAMASDLTFTLVACGLYGVFGGAFAGRSMRLWRLTADAQAGRKPALA